MSTGPDGQMAGGATRPIRHAPERERATRSVMLGVVLGALMRLVSARRSA